MTLLVSFQWFTLIKFYGLVFALSNMNLLILQSSFLAGFSLRTLEMFKKFGLWSFTVIKQLFLRFTKNRWTTSLFSIIFFTSALTLFLNLSGNFLYVDVIGRVVNLLYLSFSIWYIFDVLSPKTKSFFDFFIAWRLAPCLILIYDVLHSFRVISYSV